MATITVRTAVDPDIFTEEKKPRQMDYVVAQFHFLLEARLITDKGKGKNTNISTRTVAYVRPRQDKRREGQLKYITIENQLKIIFIVVGTYQKCD